MPAVGEVLRKARALIADGWLVLDEYQPTPMCRRYEETPTGDYRLVVCAPDHPDVATWDLFGALEKAAGGNGEALGAVHELLGEVLGDDAPGPWADEMGRTQAEVLELLDRAILRADRIARAS